MPLSFRRIPVLTGALLLALTGPVAAHPDVGFGGLAAGFSHPLHGWDHFLVMVAVGLWAAQHQGHARWAIPATFVAVMGIGGAAGALGMTLPGAEAMILVSVIALAGLVLARRRLPLAWGSAAAGLFALFHGLAHGQEMEDPAMLLSFGTGFMIATALLHGLGYAIGRIAGVLGAHPNTRHI